MSVITEENITKLAELSRLDIKDEQKADVAKNLSKIITFVSQLHSVKTENVQPMASTVEESSTPEREDMPNGENIRDDFQKIAPNVEMGFYVVPQVID